MPFRVLVVDDETAIREAIRMTLEYEGYRIDEARSGSDALDKAGKVPYDAILLDIKMPVLDGIEVLENLKEQKIAAPVIMVSGDEAVCRELHELSPNAQCTIVKWGVHRTFGFALSHEAARDMIRKTAKLALERISECKPVKLEGPVEVKVEFTPDGLERRQFLPGPGIEKLDSRTWVFRGKDIVDAFTKFRPAF